MPRLMCILWCLEGGVVQGTLPGGRSLVVRVVQALGGVGIVSRGVVGRRRRAWRRVGTSLGSGVVCLGMSGWWAC